MAYLAIARKWRPHKFEDLVGQGHVVQTLRNAIEYQRVSHAYLFSGARGIGKTSVARIFAKALRCPNVKEAIPCNTCEECVAISESRSIDVMEIDGASNNGVEAVRGIRDSVAFGAATGKYKIYIIDEVHMLSISAFNALLKTLEEPPEHVIFLFATTEVQKIPLTILSRCQRFEFKRLKQTQIVDRLKQILETEKIKLEPAGLTLIASHADGSLRDALSLLDQVLSFYSHGTSELAITEKEVVESLGVSESSAITDYWKAIFNKDITAVLKVIGDNFMAGIDLKHFSEKCLEELRLLYLVTLSLEDKTEMTAESLDISTIRFTQLSDLAKTAKVIQIERMAQILSKVIEQLSWASEPRFALEMASVRMTKLDALARMESAEPMPMTNVAAKPLAAPIEKKTKLAAVPSPEQSPAKEIVEEPPPIGEPEHYQAPPQNDQWRGFVDFVMKKRPILGALLSHANFRMEVVNGGKQVVMAFSEGSFYEKQSKDPKNQTEINEFAKTFFGPDAVFVVSNVLLNTEKSIVQTKDEAIALLKKNALEHPMVLQAKEMLGADIVDVRVEG